jgi:hypothetical protein
MPFLVVVTGKGFFSLRITTAPIPAFLCKTHEAIVCITRGGVRHKERHDRCGAPRGADSRATMSLDCGTAGVEGWQVGLRAAQRERPSSVGASLHRMSLSRQRDSPRSHGGERSHMQVATRIMLRCRHSATDSLTSSHMASRGSLGGCPRKPQMSSR